MRIKYDIMTHSDIQCNDIMTYSYTKQIIYFYKQNTKHYR